MRICVALSFFYSQTIHQGPVFKIFDILEQNTLKYTYVEHKQSKLISERQRHKFLRFGFEFIIA